MLFRNVLNKLPNVKELEIDMDLVNTIVSIHAGTLGKLIDSTAGV